MVRQVRWRLRRWTLEPWTCTVRSPPVVLTINPATLTFFESSSPRELGYLAGVVGPGCLLFQPVLDIGSHLSFIPFPCFFSFTFAQSIFSILPQITWNHNLMLFFDTTERCYQRFCQVGRRTFYEQTRELYRRHYWQWTQSRYLSASKTASCNAGTGAAMSYSPHFRPPLPPLLRLLTRKVSFTL